MQHGGAQHGLDRSASVSDSDKIRNFLLDQWVIRVDKCSKLAERCGPPDRKSESVQEWIEKTKGLTREMNQLLNQIRQIPCYLGINPKRLDTPVSEGADWVAAATWARLMIQNGESDEAVAQVLRDFAEGRKSRRGRPKGAMNFDGQALEALALHHSDPHVWTWPKLADRLLRCKVHEAHTWDSDCTARLKQAVTRLRKFLRELQS